MIRKSLLYPRLKYDIKDACIPKYGFTITVAHNPFYSPFLAVYNNLRWSKLSNKDYYRSVGVTMFCDIENDKMPDQFFFHGKIKRFELT